MMKHIFIFLFFGIFVLFLSGCDPTTSGGPTDSTPTSSPYPNVSINASIQGAGVILSWDIDIEITGFTVFRKTGTGNLIELEEAPGINSSYFDTNCPLDEELTYSIRFTISENDEFESLPSNSLIIPSMDVTAYAYKADSEIHLEWIYQDEVDEIRIFRRISGFPNSIQEIGVCEINTNFFKDTDVLYDTEYIYSIEVVYTNGTTNVSQDSNMVVISISDIIVVGNLDASVLKHTGKIDVTWSFHEDASYYKIYRYNSKADQNPVSFITESNINFYEDKTTNEYGPLIDTPYYYKVSIIEGSYEHPQTSAFAFGIFSSVVDLFEPNDRYYPPIHDEAKNLIPGVEETAVLYSFADGDGAYMEDVDWYSFSGNGDCIAVIVTMQEYSPLIGNIQLSIHEGNEYLLNDNVNTIYIEDSTDFIFRIEFCIAGNDQLIDLYFIEVEYEKPEK